MPTKQSGQVCCDSYRMNQINYVIVWRFDKSWRHTCITIKVRKYETSHIVFYKVKHRLIGSAN